MEFILISLIFLILLLMIVWRPFFKQSSQTSTIEKNLRDQTNVQLYHEHKQEIEKDYGEGSIDEESYQYLLAELDNTLLQDIETNSQDKQEKPTSTRQYSILWPIGLSAFIVFFSILLYNKQGSFKVLTEFSNEHSKQESMSAEQMQRQRQNQALAHIEKLQKHVKANPTDGEAWYNLGQTYVAVGNFDQAVDAFQQVIDIEGEQADLLGAIAQALYYKNAQQLNSTVQEYIDRALAIDVNDPSTNILLGMHNFISQDYQQAIVYWQRVIDLNKPGVNNAALKQAVAEAKNRLNIPQESLQSLSGPQLKISVSLTDTIAKQLAKGEDRVVFVYAVPTNGQRMPLAAVKLKASDLPTVVVLNNSQAMSSEHTLASVEKVHVYAIVSKLGGVGIKSGDYKAEARDVLVNSETTLELVVNHLVE
ncbi:c-type cytochrome biogenesis protein CcmI [Colwelliaceae bacterium MEBiC 14330]